MKRLVVSMCVYGMILVSCGTDNMSERSGSLISIKTVPVCASEPVVTMSIDEAIGEAFPFRLAEGNPFAKALLIVIADVDLVADPPHMFDMPSPEAVKLESMLRGEFDVARSAYGRGEGEARLLVGFRFDDQRDRAFCLVGDGYAGSTIEYIRVDILDW